jgi:hypothetical protein
MKHGFVRSRFTRRQFLKRAARQTGLTGLGGVLALAASRAARANPGDEPNPFAYDLGRLQRTDPKLVHYELQNRIRAPRAEPRRLALGPGPAIYVAAGNYISVMDSAGAVTSEIALAAPARCLSVTPAGILYAGLRDHIEVFDARGQRQAAWEAPAKRTWFTGLVVTDKEVFAADAGNRVVLRYDRSGKLLGRIGEKNKERNVPGFIVPSPFFDLKAHQDGLLRVVNPGRHRVEAYTREGDFEFAWGKPSAAIEGFCGCCNPVSLALMADGRFVTCEKGLPRVKVYSAQGEFESVVAGVEAFSENAKACAANDPSDCTKGGLDAAVDADGRVYVLDLVAGDVRVMVRKASRQG